jgi:crossover junction endodeoxyribonuclease RuvC
VRAYLPATVAIEHVAARPGQGVSSMFRFGQAVGVIAGVAAALGTPIEWISPARWKKAAGLGSDKELSRLRAIDAWPQQARLFSRRKDHNRAEAALIAAWHRKHGRMSTGSDIGGVNG